MTCERVLQIGGKLETQRKQSRLDRYFLVYLDTAFPESTNTKRRTRERDSIEMKNSQVKPNISKWVKKIRKRKYRVSWQKISRHAKSKSRNGTDRLQALLLITSRALKI